MLHIKIDYRHCLEFIGEKDIQSYQQKINTYHHALWHKTEQGNDFLGWIDVASRTSDTELQAIEDIAAKLKAKSDIFVVVGIGGSYLGARAVIEALQPHFAHLQSTDTPQIVYAGHHLSEDYLYDLLQVLDNKDYSIAVISKSGTTTEPALAFRVLKQHIEHKYGKAEAATRIVAITDAQKGALKSLATQEGYTTLVVSDDIGGRFSVLSPVGLLPIAVAGFDIHALMRGAKDMELACKNSADIKQNPAALYAALRHALLDQGKQIEVMVNYLPALFYFNEWWKQLYGESEGKQHKGLFPAAVSNTTDLHSMGQYIQDGPRLMFETVLSVQNSQHQVAIPKDEANTDGLNYLTDKSITTINHFAETGTTLAHIDGGVPNIRIEIPEIKENVLGELIYFYEFACGLSAYMLEVNPFDQPGVEDYKRNMFALLGKPGFEAETQNIQTRLQKK